MEYDICHKFHSTLKITTQHRGVKRGILLCGVGIQLSTEILQTAIHLICLTALRTLEECVLGEVRYAILTLALVTAARIDNHSAVHNTTTHLTVNATNAIRQYICFELCHYSICSFRNCPV